MSSMTNRTAVNDESLEIPGSSLSSYVIGSIATMDKGMSAILAGLLAALFYLWSICPTIGFGDAAIMIDAMKRGIVSSHVNNHPWTVLTGMYFLKLPFGDYAFRGNLVSLFYGSLTIGFFHLALANLCSKRWITWLFTASLAVCQSMWWHSTIVENYATSAFAVSLALVCWTRWAATKNLRWLCALSFVAALSVGNHVENGFLCLGVLTTGLIAASRDRSRQKKILIGCALAAIAGFVPWTYLVIKDSFVTGGIQSALKEAFVGKFADTFFAAEWLRALWDTGFVVWYQSPLMLASVCCVVGILVAKKDARSIGMLVHVAAVFAVFAFYPTWDKFAFLLPAFVSCYYFAAWGFEYLWDRVGDIIIVRSLVVIWAILSVIAPPFIYDLMPMLGTEPSSFWFDRFNNSYSGGLYRQGEYIGNPNKRGFTDVANYAEALFEKLPSGSVYLDDDSRSYYPLAEYYQRHYGRRPDVSVVLMNSWGFSDWGLTKNSVIDLMEKSYTMNFPFFLPALGRPYAETIRAAQERFPVKFAEFQLAGNRTIYRLQTVRDESDSRDIEAAVRKFGVRTIQSGGVTNLNTLHLLFYSAVFVERQLMTGFGTQWVQDDQVFVNSAAPGSTIDLVLESRSATTGTLEIVATTAPDFGNVQVRNDDGVIGSMDLYSSDVIPRTFSFPMKIPLGQSRVTLRVTGKSESSTGFNFGIDTVQLRLD